jgi:integrase/recombinase XerD
MTALAPALQAFFTDRLALQRQASGHTVAAYRDALRMLIVFAAQRAGKAPSRLDIADLDAQAVGAFLNHLEAGRGNTVRTRNARLAAIHSLFGYAAVRHPEHAADIQRVLAIPPKRYDKALITYLTQDEITALLAAPDLTTWTGRRDQSLLVLACQTGLRATELTSLVIGDVHLGTGAHVSCLGKGSYLDVAVMPTGPRSARMAGDPVWCCRDNSWSGGRAVRLSRKASMVSEGWYRPGGVSSGVARSRVCSLACRSA